MSTKICSNHHGNTHKETSKAKNYLTNAEEIQVGSRNEGAENVNHIYYMVHAKDKYLALKRIVDYYPRIYAIIFCRTRMETQEVADWLIRDGYNADALHGDLSQQQRDSVMRRFRLHAIQLLVATDVAGRGIDIKGLEYVINFDFPYEAEDYVHRIGRTGRAGSTGVAISFADEFESCQIPDIEKYINEPLKCTVIGPDDPLMKEVPARGSHLAEVDSAARAAVDAREAAGEEEKQAAAAMVGANAVTGTGKPARLSTECPQRELPKFEHALDEKAPPPDESNIYSKPVEQKNKLEEWSV